MKKSKLIITAVIVCLLLISSTGLAEKRHIYIGDIIKLKVANTDLTPEEIRQKFSEKEFEIVNLTETARGYQLEVRTFKPGEKIIKLQNKELKIEVKSTLEAIDREQIYGSELSPKEAPFTVPYQYLLSGLLLIALLGGSIVFWRFIKKHRKNSLSPYQQFKQQVEEAEVEGENYFVELTLAVKRYLEREFNCRLRGKTTAEVIKELDKIDIIKQHQKKLETWLKETETYKYTPEQADKEKKEQFKEELINLVNQIKTELKKAE